MKTETWAISLVLFGTLVGSWGAFLLKVGANTVRFSLQSFIFNWRIILGVLFYGITSILFLIALKGGQLSVLYPISSLNYIWISLISVKLLNEKMNKAKIIGILFILVGVFFIGLGNHF